MTPYLSDPDVTLYAGDALEVLRELPAESVHCIATSPPFYALRDYGVDGQIGLEATPEEWAQRLVDVFREARRVLRKDGTLWVECGDSYGANQGGTSKQVADTKGLTEGHVPNSWGGASVTPMAHPYKAKDLIGAPWLLAFALRADGWWLRGCNIWAKPNAMPESAKDRCTTAHSYVFQFSRSARYFFDGDAISEGYNEGWAGRLDTSPGSPGRLGGPGGFVAKGPDGRRKTHVQQGDNSIQHRNGERWPNPNGRHPRSVWNIPTQGFPEAHFATWPEALARRIILAACPEQVCSECGKARVRITSVEYGKSPAHGAGSIVGSRGVSERTGEHLTQGASNKEGRGGQPRVAKLTTTEGFTDCGHNAYVPGTVLDPFAGSGTTLYVARKLGRRGVGIDLNPEYLEMAARRLQQQSLLTEIA